MNATEFENLLFAFFKAKQKRPAYGDFFTYGDKGIDIRTVLSGLLSLILVFPLYKLTIFASTGSMLVIQIAAGMGAFLAFIFLITAAFYTLFSYDDYQKEIANREGLRDPQSYVKWDKILEQVEKREKEKKVLKGAGLMPNMIDILPGGDLLNDFSAAKKDKKINALLKDNKYSIKCQLPMLVELITEQCGSQSPYNDDLLHQFSTIVAQAYIATTIIKEIEIYKQIDREGIDIKKLNDQKQGLEQLVVDTVARLRSIIKSSESKKKYSFNELVALNEEVTAKLAAMKPQ